jgi:hypothetical protein
MLMNLSVPFPSLPRLRPAAVILALMTAAASAQAQTANTGTTNLVDGSLYTGEVFQNTATGTFTNQGSTVTYAGASVATFVNNGTYAAALAGSLAAIDQFIGPNGAAGPQEIAGSVAPAFYQLLLANGE